MRNVANKDDNVDTLSAAEFNKSIMEELENAVTKTGITLDSSGGPDTDSLMLARSQTITSQGAATYQDSGAADAYVLTAIGGFEQPVAYTDGMSVTFKAGNANTGASTVNVAGIGVRDVVDSTGSALTGDELAADAYVSITFDLGNDRFELALGVASTVVAASETVAGISELSTTAEAQAGVDDLTNMTPLKTKESVETFSVFANNFESAEQVITAAGGLTLAHSLGGKPDLVTVKAICKTAELNYSVGDELWLSGSWQVTSTANDDRGVSVVGGTTNLEIRYAPATTFQFPNKNTGVRANITNNNWRIIFYGFVI